MRLSAEQFVERPPKALSGIYVIHGAEPLAALEAADLFRELARAGGYVEREVFTAEANFDWGRLAAAGSALSLFATQRMIEIRLPTGKPGREGSAAIESYCQRPPEDTLTLVTLPEIDWQGKQTKWFTALEKTATMIEAGAVERAQLPRWLAGRLSRQQQSCNAAALEFLADRVEGNLLAARQEIQKLALLRPPGEISLAVLEASVANVSRFNPFQLVSALYDEVEGGKAARIARMLDGLKAEGEAPPLILWVLANEVRTLLRARGATRAGRPPPPSKARELEANAKRHSVKGLARLNQLAARIDRMIKGLDGDDPWQHLFQLACGLAGVKATVARAEWA
ncbi:MAG: DNA polymerase III subunit delta [Betaproteobacteria bacterium]|nr:DNA polymerase III subunit delta [Betaproteobacteria bacterium]